MIQYVFAYLSILTKQTCHIHIQLQMVPFQNFPPLPFWRFFSATSKLHFIGLVFPLDLFIVPLHTVFLLRFDTHLFSLCDQTISKYFLHTSCSLWIQVTWVQYPFSCDTSSCFDYAHSLNSPSHLFIFTFSHFHRAR